MPESPLVIAVVLLIVIALALLAFGLYLISVTYLPAFFGGGPYVPSSRERIADMIRLAGLSSGDRIADLGSGDGRIVFAALKAGAGTGTGYEINPILVWRSNVKARMLGLANRSTFVRRSFWDAPLGSFDVIFLYQLTGTMKRLEDKVRRELPPGSRVVSNAFTFNNWTPESQAGKVYLYRVPDGKQPQ